MSFPGIPEATRLALLAPPAGRVAMVLDTDTYNEIDDQFALVYALRSPERLQVEAIYAAPFHNSRSSGPGEGMERSYAEILRLLARLNHAPDGFVFKGATGWLDATDAPPRNPAAEDLIQRALAERDGPLYVVAIGAITNIATAILLEPRIIERIVVVWLAGNPHTWPWAAEFNLSQDLAASRLIFDCGVPLVFVPCINVAEHLRTTVPEIERHVKGRGPIGDYLHAIYVAIQDDRPGSSRVLWDIAPVAWLIDPDWVATALIASPLLTAGQTWSHDPRRHFIREAYHVQRDAIFADLFGKLARGDQ